MEEVAKDVTPPPGNKEAAKWRPPVLIGKDDTPPVAIPAHLLAPSARRPPAPAAGAAPSQPQGTLPGMLVETPTGTGADGSENVSEVIRSLVARCVDHVVGTGAPADATPTAPGASAPVGPLEQRPVAAEEDEAAVAAAAAVQAAAAEAAADAAAADEAAETLAAMEAALAGRPPPVMVNVAAGMDTGMPPLTMKPEGPAAMVICEAPAAAAVAEAEAEVGSAAGVYETRHMADPELVRAAIEEAAEAWRQRALDVERVGGFRPAEVDDLLDSQQQFDWGDIDPEVLHEARNKLLSAKDWYADVQARPPCLCLCSRCALGGRVDAPVDLECS